MSTLVLRNGKDVRRRIALAGGLTLLALSLFAAGVVLGAWAGVVRIWPVRYSLMLLHEAPKPFVLETESPPIAIDSAGRLLRYPGKIEAPCPNRRRRRRSF